MAGSLPLHVPAICPHPLLPRETEARKGISSSYRPSLAQLGVVPTAPLESNRLPSSVAANTGHSDQPRGLQSPNDCRGPPATVHMACLRSCHHQEILAFSTESAYTQVPGVNRIFGVLKGTSIPFQLLSETS